MLFQLVVLDVNSLIDLGSHNPFYVMWMIFVLGGWIPFTFVFLWGMKKAWLNWREDLFMSKIEYTLLAVDVPKENEQLPMAVENIFSHLHGAMAGIDFIEKWWKGKLQPTYSFEICSHGGYIQFYIRCQSRLRDQVESAIFSQYPDAEINEVEDYVEQYKDLQFPHKEVDVFGTEFILKKPSYLPIRTYPEFEEKLAGEFKDPLGALLESLSKIRPEEQIWIQILARPTGGDWAAEGERYIKKVAGLKVAGKETMLSKLGGAPFNLAQEILTKGSVLPPPPEKKKDEAAMFRMLMLTPDTKAQLEGVSEKIAKLAFETKIRVVYYAPLSVKNLGRVWGQVKGSFSQYTALGMNAFKMFIPVLTKADYFWERWWVEKKKRKLLRRFYKRSSEGAPMSVLNIEELATIWHFPIMTIKAPLISKTESRRGEPPSALPTSLFTPGEGIKPTPSVKTPLTGEDQPPGPPESLPFV